MHEKAAEEPPLSTQTRKRFIVGTAAAGASLAGSGLVGRLPAAASRVGGAATLRRQRRGKALSRSETATLEAWCELLVPGARRHDVGDFVNAQLVKADEDAWLMLRYLTWPPPYRDFYRAGVAALDAASEELVGRRFTELTHEQRQEILAAMLGGGVFWDGPPPFLFYFATRGDAVDVVYGTPEGFARIDFPYQALIEPKRRPW